MCAGVCVRQCVLLGFRSDCLVQGVAGSFVNAKNLSSRGDVVDVQKGGKVPLCECTNVSPYVCVCLFVCGQIYNCALLLLLFLFRI